MVRISWLAFAGILLVGTAHAQGPWKNSETEMVTRIYQELTQGVIDKDKVFAKHDEMNKLEKQLDEAEGTHKVYEIRNSITKLGNQINALKKPEIYLAYYIDSELSRAKSRIRSN
ncbi:hypothetical protein IWQ62_005207 [Dispira parvispora]|uniref:Uncharacterized protein n=1 Tax=Dispira parvispora TaxID=1520584 RepID=A0A9W8AJA0_9FUNG|nr:hypothetical protein IWQ62_005207 [Dispira parvispora]